MTQIRPSNWVATGITSMKTYWHSKLPRVWSSRNTLNVQAFSTLVSRLNVILRKQPPHNVTLARCTTSTRRQKHPQHQTTASTARHALRNALIAPFTVIMLQFPWLLTGVVIVEKLFNYKGFGFLLVSAADQNDIDVTLACGVVAVVLVLTTQLQAELFLVIR